MCLGRYGSGRLEIVPLKSGLDATKALGAAGHQLGPGGIPEGPLGPRAQPREAGPRGPDCLSSGVLDVKGGF